MVLQANIALRLLCLSRLCVDV